jgi:acylaminoacyl-peptidase
VKPPGFDSARKYPLILSIHGGPHLAFGPRWDYRHEVMAGKGYVVAYINPRGSTGYGEAFAQATDKAFPGADYPEFEAAADHLAALPFVDNDRMYVTGGSGGGTLTAYIIGRTDRYRAAASEYPVVDYTSWSLLSDNPAIYTQHWAGGFPWTNGAHYAAISPLSLVGNVKTPTLLVCSEEDWRTPINQCEIYYTALKLRGIEAALVRYPDEAHEIQGYPSNRVSEINILLGWFARHGGPQ